MAAVGRSASLAVLIRWARGNGEETDAGADAGKRNQRRRVSVEDTAGWLGIGIVVLIYIVIIAAMLLYFAVDSKVSELQREIRGVRHEVGRVQYEVERRGEAADRNVDRLLREMRRNR